MGIDQRQPVLLCSKPRHRSGPDMALVATSLWTGTILQHGCPEVPTGQLTQQRGALHSLAQPHLLQANRAAVKSW